MACDIRDLSEKEPYLPGTKVILCLGEEALQQFCMNPGNKPGAHLDNYRGTPVIHGDKIIIATFAPQDAFDRRDYETDEEETDTDTGGSEKGHQKTKRRNHKFWLYQDTRKATRILRTGLTPSPNFDYQYSTNAGTICRVLESTKAGKLFIDIETDRHQNLTCFGFGFLPSDGTSGAAPTTIYVVPWKRWTGQLNYNPHEAASILRSLCICFRDNVVISHNGMFDWFVLAYKYKIPFPRNLYDTMVSWHRCYPEIEKSLGHLISYFTDCAYHKSDGVFDPKSPQQETQLWTYNGKDVSRMMLVYEGLQHEIKRLKCEASVEQANRSIRPYLTMQFKGLRIDTAKFISKFDETERRANALERCLHIITRRELNPRSSQQVCQYLYEDLGFKCPNEEEPTNEKTLLKLLLKHNIPSIKLILAIRGEKKLASSLKFRLWNSDIHTSIADKYTRVTCAYTVTGTDTFRLGSRALLKFRPDPGFGTNLQNWDKKKRYLIIPDEGKILGQTDQSGAEALIVAYLCRQGKFRELFQYKVKPHVFVGLHLFKEIWASELKRPIDQYLSCRPSELNKVEGWKELEQMIKDSDNWSSERRFYYIAKQTCHSANYDVKGPTFQINTLLKSEGTVNLTIQQAKQFLEMYHQLFPEIREWHSKIQDELKNRRKLSNLFGFPRSFHAPFGEELFKAGYAFIPQSTVGSITNIAITELQTKIETQEIPKEYGFDLLQNGHDSIMWQCNQGYELQVAPIVKAHIEKEFTNHEMAKFKMGSETQIGLNWMPQHDKKNPNGLREIKL